MMTDSIVKYVLHLADNALIMGHRLSEWTGHGPMLEQDIAITNIALDLIGQSRNFYQYAAILQGNDATEDSLAYLRNADEFKNHILVELPNGDWADTIVKLFSFSSYQYLLYEKLFYSTDKQLSAIAEKSLKEVTYHVRWSSEWIIRLGDGTTESHKRLQTSLKKLWPYSLEIFLPTGYEIDCAKKGIGVDVASLKNKWYDKIKNVLTEATVDFSFDNFMDESFDGKEGKHTSHLKDILEEMQFLQRTYPGCEW